MADGTFNIAKGHVNEYVQRVVDNDPANSAIGVLLLETTAADATLIDFDTVAAILAGTSVEATFTNYARITNTDAELSAPTVDDANDRKEADIPDPSYTAAGGTTDSDVVKMITYYDADTTTGTDANLIPLTHHDVTLPGSTTNGTDLTLTINAAGFFRGG